jgi:5-formyltetrahydrofolate cyclo-ligase
MVIQLDKRSLRRSLLSARSAIPADRWQQASEQLSYQLSQTSAIQTAKTVLAYFSTRCEPDLSALFAQQRSLAWGFPRCQGKVLFWHQCDPFDSTQHQSGAYGITEPAEQCPQLSAKEVDLILVPAVACDRDGYRLGYGGGFYDRLFSQPDWAQVPTIGIVFESAFLPQLPHDPWDRSLTAVCTEQGLYTI